MNSTEEKGKMDSTEEKGKMDSTEEKGKLSMKAKVTLRLRQKITLTEDGEQVNKPASTAKTSFNLHKRISPVPDGKSSSVIDARSKSPLGRFNKHWTSQSVPTSPTHSMHTRIYPSSTSDWRKSSHPSDDSSSTASNDSAFSSDSSTCNSVKSWHPGINYKPTHPIYTMPTDHANVFYSSSRGSDSSGDTTPTPGSPSQEKEFPFGKKSSRSSRHRISESSAQTQLNIEPKKFTEQDKHILEEFFPTSTKTTGLKGTKNFINSAVFKESRKRGEEDVQSLKQPQIQMKFGTPTTPTPERRGNVKQVLVFPENSPGNFLPKSASPRVSSLVNHFNIPTSPQLSPKTGERKIPERPASAGRMATCSTLPREETKEYKINSVTTNRDLTESCEVIKSKPYETKMFQDASRRQSFLDNYLVRLQKNSTSSQRFRSTVDSPEMKRGSLSSGANMDLSQMRPMSTSAIFVKQDSFTNDPYKRKSFLDKYLSRQGQTQFIGKKDDVKS